MSAFVLNFFDTYFIHLLISQPYEQAGFEYGHSPSRGSKENEQHFSLKGSAPTSSLSSFCLRTTHFVQTHLGTAVVNILMGGKKNPLFLPSVLHLISIFSPLHPPEKSRSLLVCTN